MKNLLRMTLPVCCAFALLASAAAQESFGGFDDFSDGFSDGFGSSDAAVSPFTFGLRADTTVRALVGGDAYKGYFDLDDVRDAVSAVPSLTFDLGYSLGAAEAAVKVAVDTDAVKNHPEDIIEELTLRAYLGDFVLEAGKMKVVWGKGDKLHVLDNFNANDYTDFIIPDYIDRRLAEPMLRAVWNSPLGLRAEAVYTPLMTADRLSSSGMWVPAQSAALTAKVTEVLGVQAAAALNADDAAALLAVMNKADSVVPKTDSFDYGQAGFRLTGTAGIADWGVSYYYGHYKQPSVSWAGYVAAQTAAERAKAVAYQTALGASKSPAEAEEAAKEAYIASVAAAGDSALPSLHYDRLQVFGLEGAAVLGMFNLRAEAAYYLTGDTSGDDPWVHNNSINWIAGFDVDLPIHNVNVNVQNNGSYLLNNDKIDSVLDADYDAKDRYTNNKLVVALTDTFLHEKLELACNVLWGIERGDVLVMPKVTYTVTPGLDVSVSGLYITGSDDSEFAAYRDNSFVQLKVAYSF
ncbi:DUF1302 family protein [Treponema brennaborense]|uniref:Uncharacterized protein n=1 Tax=Treponema brennaborense (strain DSM 12168 / CIP 105900 / DD5/3) TaxID=906968 RepID=F4LJ72_TREBD|nr:DUF1302 family protein [Treponema brennaborense]AEE16329.1 hypothetical protein Trebr_0893 [Treponema brennaborense DSM 12168]